MGIKDLLKKKPDKLDVGMGGEGSGSSSYGPTSYASPSPNTHLAPEFKFIRSDTNTQEIIEPPEPLSAFSDSDRDSYLSPREARSSSRLSLDVFRSNSNKRNNAGDVGNNSGGGGGGGGGVRSTRSASVSSGRSAGTTGSGKESAARRLSHRLHLHRNPTSENVPEDLPEIVTPDGGAGVDDGGNTESQWERRATILARENEKHRSRPGTPGSQQGAPGGGNGLGGNMVGDFARMHMGDGSSDDAPPASGRVSPSRGVVSSKAIDDDIQQAIALHEAGDFERSTAMFGRLANANNPLSQVLYGLALRHGWGCNPDPEKAVTYLTAAASNAAEIENLALQAGLKKGGAAKGELVLAIFELGNCFRHGWGIKVDPVAAKQYYETAANLGDTDAMNEVAWCYLEGFGTKKDKFTAAQYYRKAEDNGNKTIGNSWIWKDKYNPDKAKKK